MSRRTGADSVFYFRDVRIIQKLCISELISLLHLKLTSVCVESCICLPDEDITS